MSVSVIIEVACFTGADKLIQPALDALPEAPRSTGEAKRDGESEEGIDASSPTVV